MSNKAPEAIPEAISVSLQEPRYVLRLYIAGSTPRSSRAITNLKTICEIHLKDRYDLTIVDLYEQRNRGQEDQIWWFRPWFDIRRSRSDD